MTATSFHSLDLTSEASLNHLVLERAGALGVEGRTAEEVCSRDALYSLATAIGLSGLRRGRLADDLAAAVVSPDARVARSAAAVLHTFGMRLGALIATLRDPETADRQGSTPYSRAFLAHWTTVDGIWLAGGLLAGGCGPLVLSGVKAAAALVPGAPSVAVVPLPELGPLIGAARHVSMNSGDGAAVVADLGHTRIKTAVAERRGRTLLRLHRVRARPVPRRAGGDGIEAAVGAALVQAFRDAAGPAPDRVPAIVPAVISVASFVRDGLPADDGQGVYGYLSRRTPALRRRIRAATGIRAGLRYLHDGTAAAAAAPTAGTATITAGTWLGAGFQPVGGPPLLTVPRDRPPIAWADGLGTPMTRDRGRTEGHGRRSGAR
ncbi:hypothetical protein E1281_13555 [Actinomadura sp. KC345]|uniref:hypothetical protein n=1 Tax=Actinomadura sp. KC345 TaxID=2530371 RepID=UPI00104C8C90|nr:hypothetical protein [Actinomadura sp. KC345]TDC55245.1 hypothetical protein E1281_13555 [Actinomadura sp. KC345]